MLGNIRGFSGEHIPNAHARIRCFAPRVNLMTECQNHPSTPEVPGRPKATELSSFTIATLGAQQRFHDTAHTHFLVAQAVPFLFGRHRNTLRLLQLCHIVHKPETTFGSWARTRLKGRQTTGQTPLLQDALRGSAE